MTTNTTTNAAQATDAAREDLLNLISGRLEAVRAMPEDRLDWLKEAAALLREVEAWAVERHPAGYLIYRDPADSITMEAI